MADGRHFENRYIAISRERFDLLPRNLVWWYTVILLSPLAVKVTSASVRGHTKSLRSCTCALAACVYIRTSLVIYYPPTPATKHKGNDR